MGAKSKGGSKAAVKPSAAAKSRAAECQRAARQGCMAAMRRAARIHARTVGSRTRRRFYRIGLACTAGVLRGVLAACADGKGGVQ